MHSINFKKMQMTPCNHHNYIPSVPGAVAAKIWRVKEDANQSVLQFLHVEPFFNALSV